MNMRFVIISTILIAAFTTFISFSLPLTAFAQIENYTPLVGNIPGLTDTSVSGGLVGWISNIYRFLVGVTAVLAIVMIFVAGFQYVVSGDSSGKRQAARDRIAAALGGLLLAVSSFIILNTINPQLVKINLTFEKVKVPESDGIGAVGGGEAARGGAANNPNSFFFGGAGVDPNFVKHTDRNNPLWNYYHGDGSIPVRQQIDTGIGVPRGIPTGIGAGNASGSITLSHFGGKGDVRVSSGGFALQYCNNPYGGYVGSFVEPTQVGGTTYRWCYALTAGGSKISFPDGSRSAHGGYYETAAVSGERFSAMNSQSYYVAYPLDGKALSNLPDTRGVTGQNTKLRKYYVTVTTKNGTAITGYIADRGPHASLNKLDVSRGMYDAINRNGGAASARLVDGSGQTITSL